MILNNNILLEPKVSVLAKIAYMSELAQHTLIRGTKEKVVNLLAHVDPNQSAYVRKFGWKVKTIKTKVNQEIIDENNAKMDAKQAKVDSEPTKTEDNPPQGEPVPDTTEQQKITELEVERVKAMNEAELKAFLSDKKIKFGRAGFDTLLRKALESLNTD